MDSMIGTFARILAVTTWSSYRSLFWNRLRSPRLDPLNEGRRYSNLSLPAAKAAIRTSSQPWRQRLMFVLP